MKDWRYFDPGPDWDKATVAEKMACCMELSVKAFKGAGLYSDEPMDRTKVRKITYEQMNREDEEFGRLLSARLSGNRE